MREEGIDFQPRSNAFMRCAKPGRLQELADALTPRDLVACGQGCDQRRERGGGAAHFEVTVVAGFFSDSSVAPCSRLTAAWSWVSLSLSGGT